MKVPNWINMIINIDKDLADLIPEYLENRHKDLVALIRLM